MIRRRVVITGRVQGVFFRDSTRREATDRGVAGWVTNRADGAVEAVFEGSTSAVEAMIRWAQDGPPHAEVARVEVFEEPPTGEQGFEIR